VALPYTEEMPLLGTNPYDASKVCTDVLAQSYRATYDLPIGVARCANIYGGGDLNFSRLVPGTIRSTLRGELPVIRSDGSPIRDYLYVDDAVRAYLALAEQVTRGDSRRQVFNFGSDTPLSVRDLVVQILNACGAGDLQPDVRGVGTPAGEIDRQYLDSARARTLMGWNPEVALEMGLSRTVAWYREFLRTERLAATSARAVP
jgi:CDP-glucose 4,6-dehydratase